MISPLSYRRQLQGWRNYGAREPLMIERACWRTFETILEFKSLRERACSPCQRHDTQQSRTNSRWLFARRDENARFSARRLANLLAVGKRSYRLIGLSMSHRRQRP